MNKKVRMAQGFTLAELLIVVAIIGVLVAISIPIFGSRLEGSRESTDAANLRSAYAAATAVALTGKDNEGHEVTITKDVANYFVYTKDGELKASSDSPMKGKSTQDNWQGTDLSEDLPGNIIFNGNSGKNPIYIEISENGNKVRVAFAETANDFPKDTSSDSDSDSEGGGD